MLVALEAAIPFAHCHQLFFVFLEARNESNAFVNGADTFVHATHVHADAFDADLEPEGAAIGGMDLAE